MDAEEKLDNLKAYFNGKKVLVAFSGGADSTLLALMAKDGAKEALAVTVDNGLMPSNCMDKAEEIAGEIGIKHFTIRENFLKDDEFAKNPPNRCYICKNKIYQYLTEMALDYHYDLVVDGTNLSDLMEDRPGIIVNREKNIKMPLVKFGFSSKDVRTILKDWNINYHPSTTCLATRIPAGCQITLKKINRIAYAENLVRALTGLDVVRVRDDEGLALIQVGDIEKLLDKALLCQIDSELKAVGFKKINLDIDNYGDFKTEIMVYKPCKDEKNRIMFETQLPYQFNIQDTCHELKQLGAVKCSVEMGIAMLEIDGSSITLFASGKIVVRRVKDQKDAQELLMKILPCIRRKK
ncbi:MAG: ATP-dependent sacrificial sulfur transferase LarE [Methanobacteriaceae archaeon]|nr:ATP-dependent sacrificial sulfur transferase LarE [Methanobacteriaceae archaeon]